MKIRRLLSTAKWVLSFLLITVYVHAQPTTESSVPIPHPPKAKQDFSNEQACVEPLDIIRRYHGDFLKHQRGKTMHQGIRTKQHSLVECVNCHVTADAQGEYPSIHEGTDHFCRNCHSYAAVTIDCFECHASKPDTSNQDNEQVTSNTLDPLATPSTKSSP